LALSYREAPAAGEGIWAGPFRCGRQPARGAIR